MIDDNPLYRITVTVNTEDLDRGAISAEDLKTAHHRTIDVRCALDPETKDQYDREKLFTAFRWCAGILARLAVFADYAIRQDAKDRGHRCDADFVQSARCGCSWEEGVYNPRWAVDESGVVPEVSFDVPRQAAKHWVKVLERWVAEMLADEMTPHGPAPSEPEHGQVLLTESTPTSKVAP